MPATVTLSSTTLLVSVGASDRQIKVASTTGIAPGVRLWIDRELMDVISLDVSPWVNVRRGADGTAATAHDSAQTILIGSGNQFYSQDPKGRPPEAIPVSPYVNVTNGNVWYAQGDAGGTGNNRWWQMATTTYELDPFGNTVPTTSPTSST